jgi:hypothetical protein
LVAAVAMPRSLWLVIRPALSAFLGTFSPIARRNCRQNQPIRRKNLKKPGFIPVDSAETAL